MKITIIDTETTGFIPRDFESLDECPYMVQLGAITYDTNLHKITEQINSIVALPSHINIPKSASDIHHITRERIDNEGEDIITLLHTLNTLFKNSDYIIGHNLEYDLNIVNYDYMRNNVPFEFHIMQSEETYCTMIHGKDLCKIKRVNSKGTYHKYPTLEELHKHLFGEELHDLHDAYNDSLICLRCYMYMKHKIDVTQKNKEIEQMITSLVKSNSSSDEISA